MLSKNQIAELIPPEKRYIYKVKINRSWEDCDKRRYNRSDKNKRMKIDRAKRYSEILNFISVTVITDTIVESENITIRHQKGEVKLNTSAFPAEVTSEIIGKVNWFRRKQPTLQQFPL